MDPTVKLILAFLIGILSGAILVVVIYLLLMLITIKKRSYIVETQNQDIAKEDVLLLIDNCKERYKFECLSEDKEVREGALKRNLTSLAQEIALVFFPNSKRPLAELTMDELLMLNRYIIKRIEEIIDRPGLRMIKKLKLNTIIEISQTKKKIDNSKAMKTVEKYHLNKVAKTAMMALNAINPVYWFKTLVIDNIISNVLFKIKLAIITISGQELYKVYSKKAFTEEEENVVDDDLKEMENQLIEAQEAKKDKNYKKKTNKF